MRAQIMSLLVLSQTWFIPLKFFSGILEPSYFWSIFKCTLILLFLIIFPWMFPSWNSDLDGLADADHCDESDISSRHFLSDHLPSSTFSICFPMLLNFLSASCISCWFVYWILLLFFLQLLIWLIWSKLLCTWIDSSWDVSRVKMLFNIN